MHLNVVSGQIPDHFTVNPEGEGHEMEVGFTKGKAHNHPLIAVWVEDTLGHFIQTLYVSQSIGTGIFNYGDKSSGQWTKGELSRPAALPYWAHKRGILSDNGSYMPTSKNPVADAYTGPTPKSDFTLNLKTDSLLNSPFYVLLEINQPWDWNEYWTNTKFPDDYEYRTSSQPAVVYRCMIDPAIAGSETIMQAIGHSHYSGKDGNLYGDISTLTTALNIAGKITVKLIK
ncbi:MAG: hypothetical protein JXA03_05485 [Bacteroidales bacterium]|nr:hypothetical protein [Bacteroidales bacterium]